MPKFYGQNKKRIDPRYFLNETTNRDQEDPEVEKIDEIFGFFEGEDCWCVDRDGNKVGEVSTEGDCRGTSIKKCKDSADEKPDSEYSIATKATQDFTKRKRQLDRAIGNK